MFYKDSGENVIYPLGNTHTESTRWRMKNCSPTRPEMILKDHERPSLQEGIRRSLVYISHCGNQKSILYIWSSLHTSGYAYTRSHANNANTTNTTKSSSRRICLHISPGLKLLIQLLVVGLYARILVPRAPNWEVDLENGYFTDTGWIAWCTLCWWNNRCCVSWAVSAPRIWAWLFIRLIHMYMLLGTDPNTTSTGELTPLTPSIHY